MIYPITLNESKINELKIFYGNIPNNIIFYQLNNLSEIDNIDDNKLAQSIKNYFLKNIGENQDVYSVLGKTSGLYYKYRNKIYLFFNNLEDTLFHEMAHAIYSDKIKEIIKSKHRKLKVIYFNILDEFNAQYWETKKTKNSFRLNTAIRDLKTNKIKFSSEIHYNSGCLVALKELKSCGDISMFPKCFIDFAFNLKKCFIYNKEQLIDIDLNLFKFILKTFKH